MLSRIVWDVAIAKTIDKNLNAVAVCFVFILRNAVLRTSLQTYATSCAIYIVGIALFYRLRHSSRTWLDVSQPGDRSQKLRDEDFRKTILERSSSTALLSDITSNDGPLVYDLQSQNAHIHIPGDLCEVYSSAKSAKYIVPAKNLCRIRSIVCVSCSRHNAMIA